MQPYRLGAGLKSGALAVCDGLGLLLLRPYPPSALSRAPHRTGALAHGLADIWLTKPDRGHWGRRTETAQTTGVAECGKYDARSLACEPRANRSGEARLSPRVAGPH
jgi:hypothetical protein